MLTSGSTPPIEVIPAVDVLGEGAVRLHQGDYDEVVERAGDPVALARRFAAAGATRIHLVDLDGARSGRVRPELVAARRRGRRAGARCRPPAGSARSRTRGRCSTAGADRVVVGTAAFPDPAPWAAALGERLVVALDVRDGQVRTAGWTEELGPRRSSEAVERCLAAGVDARPLHRDRPRRHARRPRPRARRDASPPRASRVLAAGGVRSPADVAALAEAGAEAAVVGRAILVGVSGSVNVRSSR